jgi:uncharacterized protein (TIGR02145 family)
MNKNNTLMNKLNLFLLPTLAFFACAGLQAQVTIGDNTDPAPGILLDLNSTVKGGLLLSNVALTKVNVIPESFSGVTPENYSTPEVKNGFTGAMVYHTGENGIPAGVYVWNGVRWMTISGECICPSGMVMDNECNCYATAYFGAAGTWMTENLRTTDFSYVDGVQTSLVKKSTDTGSDTEPRYTYPCIESVWGNISAADRDSIFRAHEQYGLLYNWVAASGRKTNADSDNSGRGGYGTHAPTQYYRGVCPEGWHLPSDYEWIALEIEIATYPEKYSSSTAGAYFTPGGSTSGTHLYDMYTYRPGSNNELTYWGRQMKSSNDKAENKVNTTSPNGTSKSREAGGFDALLVGGLWGIGTARGYGSNAYFWSSSSYNADFGVYRALYNSYTYTDRHYINKGYLYSVRCMKDSPL